MKTWVTITMMMMRWRRIKGYQTLHTSVEYDEDCREVKQKSKPVQSVERTPEAQLC
jgi:DNA-binding FrmR family transcriptional regulator